MVGSPRTARMTSSAAAVAGSAAPEDERTQRRRLAAVWGVAGSAVAAMVAVSWYMVVRSGSLPPGTDMIGHAAAAEWLRTLPWWDWRGWSDWFFGGQAIGVNYPPLAHAWMRFTHPVHGQMAAVALGLLVFLPYGALRLARAVGYAPRAQRAAVGAVLVLTAISGDFHRVLGGFNYSSTFFSSWPAMLAVVCGLFCAAWAARCRRPVGCGVVAGVALLFNATVVPGIAVACAALLITGNVSFRQAVRWAATAGAAALAVCAWWLVPFLDGWARVVRWQVLLSEAWDYAGGTWQVAILTVLGMATAWAARSGSGPARRAALVAAAGLMAALLGDLLGYLRPDRWLAMPILVAAVAAAGLVRERVHRGPQQSVRPAWAALGVASLVVFVVVTGRWEVLPLAVWLLWAPRRVWAAIGALAWAGVLLWVPLWNLIRTPPPSQAPLMPLEAVAGHGDPDAEGLAYLHDPFNTTLGDAHGCAWGHPWGTTSDTGGNIRPLFGLYQETSPTAEFLKADYMLRAGAFREGSRGLRPHWFDTWQSAGRPSVDGPAAAEALGARWYVSCDTDGRMSVAVLSATTASSVTVVPYTDEEAWHRAAVEWWVPIAAGTLAEMDNGVRAVPILSSGESADYPMDQSAEGVSTHAAGDRLTVRAEAAGWVWLRVPWDPDWRTVDGIPVRKGGPGHLVVWANRGDTQLRWSVRGAVDVAAAATTGGAALVTAALGIVNRRRGFEADFDRRRPAAEALGVFADTVDGWARTVTERARGLATRVLRAVRS